MELRSDVVTDALIAEVRLTWQRGGIGHNIVTQRTFNCRVQFIAIRDNESSSSDDVDIALAHVIVIT